MNLMGLDLSLTSTGYCVNGSAGSISVKSNGTDRLIEIRDLVGKVVKDNNVSCAIIEGYAFSSRNSQSHSIGELGGVIKTYLQESGIPFVTVPPKCRAKFATGKGNASKNEVISSISARTGIVWSNPGADDKCDAWLLEEMGLSRIGTPRFNWPKENLLGLEAVDWSELDKIKERGNK
jgi:Holliday junction resolvasome RuvABC endonuclease subunit